MVFVLDLNLDTQQEVKDLYIFSANVGKYIVFGRISNRFQPNPSTPRPRKRNRCVDLLTLADS